MIEDQSTIEVWSRETFGKPSSNLRIAIRANEEMAELLRALAIDDTNPKAASEIADVLIVLYGVAEGLGVHLATEVNRKMAINRRRIWELDGTGHGYHVKDEVRKIE